MAHKRINRRATISVSFTSMGPVVAVRREGAFRHHERVTRQSMSRLALVSNLYIVGMTRFTSPFADGWTTIIEPRDATA